MTATLEALGERRGRSPVAVVTSEGTVWSWPELFDQFAPPIRSFARSRGAPSPEDIVQDVFASAIERFPRFEGDTAGLRSFLFTLAYRRIADEHRTAYRRKEYLVADHQPTADDRPDIEAVLTFHEEAQEAMRALHILGERERRVIEMRIIDESTPAEVARTLGISNGNVRVIQARALMKIRKYLESSTGAMPSLTLVFALFKGLRSGLPTDAGLANWVEMLRSDSSGGTIRATAAGAGSAITAGTASTASVAGTVLKIGLVLALATSSTSSIDPVVSEDRGDSVRAVVPIVQEVEPTEFSVAPAVTGEPTPEVGIAHFALDQSIPVPPTKTGNGNPESESTEVVSEPETGAAETAAEPDEGNNSEAGPIVDTGPGAIAEPDVEDVAEPVEEVVKGAVETVDTAVETVTTVVDEVVDDVVEVVDKSVTTVNDTVDTVDDTLNPVTDAISGVSGGPFG